MKKLAILTTLLLFVGAAAADDMSQFVPPWRGEVSTTLQIWEFGTDANTNVPPDNDVLIEDPYTPGYIPGTEVVLVDPFGDPGYYQEDPFGSGRSGIWSLSGTMDVLVLNHEPPNDMKIVRMQLTWAQRDPVGNPDAQPALTNLVPSADEGPTVVDEYQHCGNWQTTLYEWIIRPNPTQEEFRIQGDILVDQMVIDTWCTPEPASLGVLAFGALGVLLRRRRK